jgi:hypothetical protein
MVNTGNRGGRIDNDAFAALGHSDVCLALLVLFGNQGRNVRSASDEVSFDAKPLAGGYSAHT